MPNTETPCAPVSSTSEEVIQRILASGKITAADRTWFLNAMASDLPLTSTEMRQINQVFERLRMGLLKVVD